MVFIAAEGYFYFSRVKNSELQQSNIYNINSYNVFVQLVNNSKLVITTN